MNWQRFRFVRSALFTAAICLIAAPAIAAPRIDRLSLRGLQAGGVTTIAIDGAELLPEPTLHFGSAGTTYKIKEGATPQHLDVEVTIDGSCPSGIYLLRAGSASGISEAVALGVDNLPQLALTPQVSTTNVSLTGSVSGSAIATTKFSGKQGQQLVVELEARRLGSKLDPVVHVYDARHTQLAWSRGLAALGGDPRTMVTLPADGEYSVEVHDAVFRGAEPGFFRLKLGDFKYADLAYPLGVQQGTDASFEFVDSNLAPDVRAAGKLVTTDGIVQDTLPAPWPEVAMISGSRPAVIVSEYAELVEAPPSDKPQELSAAPIAVSGRISDKSQQDRYRLAVTPGQKLNIDVLARRRGSPLDGVLSIQNEQGAELASSDDRPETTDPGLEFTVPEGTTAIVLALRDLRAAGGSNYVYRIEVEPVAPRYAISLSEDRIHIPKDGAAIVRVDVRRAGYGGPIDLVFPNLPQSVSVTGNQIPARASQAFVTLSAPGLSPSQAVTRVLGTSADHKLNLKRRATTPQTDVTRNQPWLGDSLAVAVTTPAPIQLVWDLYPTDVQLVQGTQLANHLKIERSEGVKGAVRLSLLTTQQMPKKKIKENNQEREVDDVDRALRFAAETVIAADAAEAAPSIVIPGDLADIQYDLAIQAELLADDNKTAIATIVTPARRLATIAPIKLELAAAAVEARAGAGSTGSIAGKLTRTPGFALPVQLTLTGLPEGVPAPTFNLAADQTDFSFPVTFPFGTVAGAIPNVKLAAVCLTDPADPKTAVHTTSLDLSLSIVAGTKPPEQPRQLFEDQAEFVAALTEGGGTATLDAEQKYAGAASVRVTLDQKFNPSIPGWEIKVREKPGPGEFRYLRYAWKKQGGSAICLQLNHDGVWGPAAAGAPSFRYSAGPMNQVFGASLTVDAALPEEWEVVTRDLFADFGEFTLNGIALSPVDGEFGLYDHVYLGTSVDDFKLVKP